MKEVPHSIPDLFSENVHELGRALFNFYSSDLTPNARFQEGIECPTQTLGCLAMSLQAQRQTQPLIDFVHERWLSLAQHT